MNVRFAVWFFGEDRLLSDRRATKVDDVFHENACAFMGWFYVLISYKHYKSILFYCARIFLPIKNCLSLISFIFQLYIQDVLTLIITHLIK